MKFTWITVDAKQMGGVPCIRGLRVPVATIVGMVADGMNGKEILAAYPDLHAEDIQEALRYARRSASAGSLSSPREVPHRQRTVATRRGSVAAERTRISERYLR